RPGDTQIADHEADPEHDGASRNDGHQAGKGIHPSQYSFGLEGRNAMRQPAPGGATFSTRARPSDSETGRNGSLERRFTRGAGVAREAHGGRAGAGRELGPERRRRTDFDTEAAWSPGESS